MNKRSLAMLKAFLDHTEHKEGLLVFFPPEWSRELAATERSPLFNLKTLFSSMAWSAQIHYSWFVDLLNHYPEELQAHFLGILTVRQAQGINELSKKGGRQAILLKKSSPFLRPYLSYLLRCDLMDPELKEQQHLPTSPFNLLLEIDKATLLQLCDFLGIYDLAADLRQVVDKEVLGKIYAALKPEQLQFLHYCTKQPLKWVPPKLSLHAWNGSQKQLSDLLHYRGLIRLAKAIWQENSDYKWHLLHRFDTGRSKIIQKEFYQKQDPLLQSYFKNQVLHIAQRARIKQSELTI